jgi:hypothetical protein
MFVQPALQHLATHGISIRNVSQVMPFLDQYIEKIVEDSSIDRNRLGDPTYSTDFDLRAQLAQEKLAQVLNIQQKERNQQSIYGCLFCRQSCTTKFELFEHLFKEHGLLIGRLDNLVFVDDYLSLLRLKLSHWQCLYCEKMFLSNAILRKHMRKKKHFQINPRNPEYDRFYISNYLINTDQDEEDGDDGDFEDWNESVDTAETMCLFEDKIFSSPEECHEHMKSVHQFNLLDIPDFYNRIRLINFIRNKYSTCTCFVCETNFQNSEELKQHYAEASHPLCVDSTSSCWTDPCFLFPYYDNDPLLMLDLEED